MTSNTNTSNRSDWVELQAADGHKLKAYRALPAGKPRGAIVVVQEIFGVNGHIQSVADRFASEGYAAIAPAIFDRHERDVSLGYEGKDLERAFGLYQKLNVDHAVSDAEAAVKLAAQYGKVGLVGYCYGGLVAWIAASRANGLAASVGYYGGGITDRMDLASRVPTMLHFGTLDAHVPIAPVDDLAKKHPSVEIFRYEADHGFNCDVRGSYNAEASKTAQERTLAFFRKHVG